MAQTEAALADPGRDLGDEAMPSVGRYLASITEVENQRSIMSPF